MQLALVERARAGDEEAFASLARGAGDRLLAIAHVRFDQEAGAKQGRKVGQYVYAHNLLPVDAP